MTPFIYSSDELCSTTQGKFDVMIVGSDQVWRPDYINCISNMFLDFAESWDIKRIAYAASLGSYRVLFSENQKEQYGHLFNKFNAISFREKSALNVINEMQWFNKKIEIVLDPTMLLSQEHYMQLIGLNDAIISIPYTFGYILDSDNEDLPDLISFIERKVGYNTKQIIDFKRWKRMEYVMPSIENWLEQLIKSSFVVTDSFHGTVFAILFNKPFVTIVNPKRGVARLKDLLNDFELGNRMVRTYCDVKKIDLFDIDWKHVNEQLEKKKEASLEFLMRNL